MISNYDLNSVDTNSDYNYNGFYFFLMDAQSNSNLKFFILFSFEIILKYHRKDF